MTIGANLMTVTPTNSDVWEATKRWQQAYERRLNDIGAKVHGAGLFNADRISDLVEQIDELRRELHRANEQLQRVSERQDKMADWIKANVPKQGG